MLVTMIWFDGELLGIHSAIRIPVLTRVLNDRYWGKRTFVWGGCFWQQYWRAASKRLLAGSGVRFRTARILLRTRFGNPDSQLDDVWCKTFRHRIAWRRTGQHSRQGIFFPNLVYAV